MQEAEVLFSKAAFKCKCGDSRLMGMGAVAHTEGNIVGVSPDADIEVGVHEKAITGTVTSMLFCVGCGTPYMMGLFLSNVGNESVVKLVGMRLTAFEEELYKDLLHGRIH